MTDAGDWRIPTLAVTAPDGTPGDLTTVVTLAVIAPNGTTTNPIPTTSDGGGSWAAPGYEFTAPGEWVERWTVTGKGAGKQRSIILVAPDPTAAPSGQRVYADTTDYANWLRAAPPPGSRRALAEASREVDRMLLCAVYNVDSNGLPTDADHVVAIRDATCAQSEYMRLQRDPYGVGADRATTVTIGSLSYSRAAARPGSGGRQSEVAWQLLADAGLTGHEPRDR